MNEELGQNLKNRIDDYINDPSKRSMCLLDDAYNQLKRTYPMCPLAEEHDGKDCRVQIGTTMELEAHIVNDGLWAAVEFHGASVYYSWEAIDAVMSKGGLFVI